MPWNFLRRSPKVLAPSKTTLTFKPSGNGDSLATTTTPFCIVPSSSSSMMHSREDDDVMTLGLSNYLQMHSIGQQRDGGPAVRRSGSPPLNYRGSIPGDDSANLNSF